MRRARNPAGASHATTGRNEPRRQGGDVTGASRGVGRQAALYLAQHGAKVVLAARTLASDPTLPGSLGEALLEIGAKGGEALVVQTDLANQADLHRLVETTHQRFGRIDVLVNNAASTVGSAWSKKFPDLTFAEWSNDFDINLHAPFIPMQLVAPIMAANGGGRIVNITTGSGEVFPFTEEHVPPADVVGRNLVVPSYFASCADPAEYTGRLFWAEREMEQLQIAPIEIAVTA